MEGAAPRHLAACGSSLDAVSWRPFPSLEEARPEWDLIFRVTASDAISHLLSD